MKLVTPIEYRKSASTARDRKFALKQTLKEIQGTQESRNGLKDSFLFPE